MAQWSTGSQKYSISRRTLDQTRHFRRRALIEIFEQLAVAHKAQMQIANALYHAFLCQFAQPINWKNTIDVLVSVAMVIVFMRHHQLAAFHISRNLSPAIIASRIIRFLGTQMHASSAYQRKGAFAQFQPARRIGNTAT